MRDYRINHAYHSLTSPILRQSSTGLASTIFLVQAPAMSATSELTEPSEARLATRDDCTMGQPLARYADVDRAV
jgi:hypothetical protein